MASFANASYFGILTVSMQPGVLYAVPVLLETVVRLGRNLALHDVFPAPPIAVVLIKLPFVRGAVVSLALGRHAGFLAVSVSRQCSAEARTSRWPSNRRRCV